MRTGRIPIWANPLPGGSLRRFPLRQLAQFVDAWHRVRGDRRMLLRLWLLMLLIAVTSVWQCRAAFDAVAVPLSWEGAMIYAAAKNLATEEESYLRVIDEQDLAHYRNVWQEHEEELRRYCYHYSIGLTQTRADVPLQLCLERIMMRAAGR